VVPVGYDGLFSCIAAPVLTIRQGRRIWVPIIRDVYLTTQKVMTTHQISGTKKPTYCRFIVICKVVPVGYDGLFSCIAAPVLTIRQGRRIWVPIIRHVYVTTQKVMTTHQISGTKKPTYCRFIVICEVVPVSGLEPLLPKKPDFESSVSTNSTTLASQMLGI
jgi:hypothetical protein